MNHQIQMNPPFSSVHHHLFHPHPHCHLPRSLQLALMQIGASGVQVACGGQGDSDHLPAASHVRVARGDASGTGGALDTPSSWRGSSSWRRVAASGGRRMNDLFFILFHFATRASVMVLLLLSP